jgi:hypothetical protein
MRHTSDGRRQEAVAEVVEILDLQRDRYGHYGYYQRPLCAPAGSAGTTSMIVSDNGTDSGGWSGSGTDSGGWGEVQNLEHHENNLNNNRLPHGQYQETGVPLAVAVAEPFYDDPTTTTFVVAASATAAWNDDDDDSRQLAGMVTPAAPNNTLTSSSSSSSLPIADAAVLEGG